MAFSERERFRKNYLHRKDLILLQRFEYNKYSYLMLTVVPANAYSPVPVTGGNPSNTRVELPVSANTYSTVIISHFGLHRSPPDISMEDAQVDFIHPYVPTSPTIALWKYALASEYAQADQH